MSDSTVMGSKVAPQARRGFKMFAATALIAVSSAVSLSAFAFPGGPGGHGHHGGGFGGPGMFMGSPERLDKGVDRMLDRVGGATDAQRQQIKVIVKAAAADLATQRDAGRALREKSLQIFTAPTVDAAQAESVRQQLLAQHDTVSRRVLQAMLDISRVLTPEQRAKIGEGVKKRHERMMEHMKDRPKS